MKKYICDKDFLRDIKNDDRNVIDLDNLNADSGPEDSDKSQPSGNEADARKRENVFTPVKRKNLAQLQQEKFQSAFESSMKKRLQDKMKPKLNNGNVTELPPFLKNNLQNKSNGDASKK